MTPKFPRSADLGLIEARYIIRGISHLRRFRDQLISASLKRTSTDCGPMKIWLFPRSADLGLIEAQEPRVNRIVSSEFPRSADLGLIEAQMQVRSSTAR